MRSLALFTVTTGESSSLAILLAKCTKTSIEASDTRLRTRSPQQKAEPTASGVEFAIAVLPQGKIVNENSNLKRHDQGGKGKKKSERSRN
jgi:hypothetical protein